MKIKCPQCSADLCRITFDLEEANQLEFTIQCGRCNSLVSKKFGWLE